MKNPFIRIVAVSMLVLLIAVSCTDSEPSDSGGSQQEGGRNLVIANVQPFSGSNAAYGPEQNAGCVPAARVITEAGGVLGNTLECIRVDTRSNPTDAVPAVQQLIATEEDLVGVVGPSSDEAAAVIPLLNEAQVPYWPDTGDPRYNQQESEYFWRVIAPDDLLGLAFALWSERQGFEKVSLIAGNDPQGSQASVPSALAGLEAVGIEVVAPATNLALGQPSYRTEAAEAARADPDAIIIPTSDPQFFGTFLAEFTEFHDPVPVVGNVNPLQKRHSSAGKAALGDDVYERVYTDLEPDVRGEGQSYENFRDALLASSEEEVPDAKQWALDPYSIGPWDAVHIMALAMVSADSTDPSVFNSHVREVTDPGEGKVEVHSFAEGRDALEAGEEIRYVGALGDIQFNEWNNSGSQYAATKAKGDTTIDLGVITTEEMVELSEQI